VFCLPRCVEWLCVAFWGFFYFLLEPVFFFSLAVSHHLELHSDIQGCYAPALLFPSTVAALYRLWELFLGLGSGRGYAEKLQGTSVTVGGAWVRRKAPVRVIWAR
jgi:hypothetical protein